MEIITERHKCPDMIVPANESESSIKAEVNRRSYKAGYTDRDGQPKISRKTSYGKGDWARNVNKAKYDAECNRLGLGKVKLNLWPRDEHGNLI